MICQTCGVEAETKRVTFFQNIGALVVRFEEKAEGEFCKRCVHNHFWRMTLITLAVGWWGVISFFITIGFLLWNIVQYACCLRMPPVPAGATRPQLTGEAVAAIRPHVRQMIARLQAGDDAQKVAADAAFASGTTPGQVLLYMDGLFRAAQNAQNR